MDELEKVCYQMLQLLTRLWKEGCITYEEYCTHVYLKLKYINSIKKLN